MSMRGIYTSVNDIRKRVFAEVARLSYNYQDGDLSEMELIPYRIIPGEVSTYRESVFLERAIVKERMRLAMGLNLRTAAEHAPVSTGAEECVKPEKYYQPPLINIIKFACHACPDNQIVVTDQCQGCLAHPCREVCPRGAVSIRHFKSHIDQEKCIQCGRCVDACQYGAILRMERPCAKACGMHAIHSDEYGRANIDQDKCVSCGMCLANCPFGAIADKAQIFQTIQALRSDVPVYAAIAPAIVGQLGPNATLGKLRAALKLLGFHDSVEVAIGADLCTLQEAEDFVREVPDKLPFMGTSCCPAWSVMAKREFPQYADCISMALTPMVLTGRLIKKEHPGCKVAFIGPCAAKKLEASRRSIRSDIDLRSDDECYGMTGSPLGPTVTWFHYSYSAYTGAFSEKGMAVTKQVFDVFMDDKNYPIVFHCIGGADRTGTVAMLLEALLGVPEDELWRDYLTTGFVGGVSDAKHQQWFGSALKKLKEYPGATLADKAEAYFLKLGFTKDDVSRLRERLLER